MKIKKITQLILIALLLHSCQGAKDALQGKKRSESSDEFLIEKKNPLTMPPDIEELPLPLEEENQNKQEDNEIKELLTKDDKSESNNSNSNENTSLEKTILEKIQD
tara:strand:+ start:1624 stop:1941 length:318 start_codon:yes stop_codon:yes gene_type:complete